jgi:phage minor structural protein
MIKLYDKNEFIKAVEVKNLQITKELGTGYKTAQFQVPYIDCRLKEEMEVEIDDYLYRIKEVNMETNDLYDVYCKPQWGKLSRKSIDSLTGYNMSLKKCLDIVLEDTDWTYEFEQEVKGSYTVSISRKTALEALSSLVELYDVEVEYDTKNKRIKIWNTKGEYKESFFFNETNLSYCKVQSDTYDLVTRLIPIGKDGKTIQLVNNNCMWIEDFSYTDEVIVGYYVNTNIESADDLLKVAKVKLKDAAQPATAYKIRIVGLTSSSLDTGDTIKIIDEIKGVNRDLRIKKIVIFPDQPDKSFLEVGRIETSFDDIYKQYTDAQKIVTDNVLKNLSELNKLY